MSIYKLAYSSCVYTYISDCPASKHVFKPCMSRLAIKNPVSPLLYSIHLVLPLRFFVGWLFFFPLLYHCNTTQTMSCFGEGKKAWRRDGLLCCTLGPGEGSKKTEICLY